MVYRRCWKAETAACNSAARFFRSALRGLPDRVLVVVLMAAMLIFLVAQAPVHARAAHLQPEVPMGARMGGALLAVSDTGAGISPEELTRLSRTFEQGDAGKRQKGAGLGLSVVRAFAELHGGRLDIESRQGGGSTIAVFFPAEKTGTQGD